MHHTTDAWVSLVWKKWNKAEKANNHLM